MMFAQTPDGWTGMIIALTGLFTALGIAVSAIAAAVVKLWFRDNATDSRVDTVWKSILRRGTEEGISKYLIVAPDGKLMQPYTLNDEVLKAYAPVAPYLRKLHADNPAITPRIRFVEVIEEKLGAWLAEHICRVLNINEGACLKIAMMIATGEEPADPTGSNGKQLPPAAAAAQH